MSKAMPECTCMPYETDSDCPLHGVNTIYDLRQEVAMVRKELDAAIESESKTREGFRDILQRAHRVLRDVVKVEMSPAAWGHAGDEPYVPDAGPEWSGKPGEHPLLPMIQDTLDVLDAMEAHEKGGAE